MQRTPAKIISLPHPSTCVTPRMKNIGAAHPWPWNTLIQLTPLCVLLSFSLGAHAHGCGRSLNNTFAYICRVRPGRELELCRAPRCISNALRAYTRRRARDPSSLFFCPFLPLFPPPSPLQAPVRLLTRSRYTLSSLAPLSYIIISTRIGRASNYP